MIYAYVNKKISPERKQVIRQANDIIEEYRLQGYCITLRQLYYQFVSRNLLENSKSSYQRLCNIIRDGRMAGMIDWDVIVDRTRNLESRSHWDSPKEIIESCVDDFHVDLWEGQSNRVEVWIEKDALISVIEDTCDRWDCPYLSCRGYTSVSEMREAALRIQAATRCGCRYTILYAGDHDPSGSDMSRDIRQRLTGFGARFEFHRIALNIGQVEKFSLPPNRIKDTDSRSGSYQRRYGKECWELDALPPSELTHLIESSIESHLDSPSLFDARKREAEQGRKILQGFSKNYSIFVELLADSAGNIN